MPLTSHLSDKASPVRAYLETVGGVIMEATTGRPDWRLAMSLLGISDRPKGLRVPTRVESKFLGSVGTAFDYRLRFRLGPCTSTDLIARKYASSFTRGWPFFERTADFFFEHLDLLLEALEPHGGQLKARDEQLLARYCMTLACMEASYRSPRYTMPMPSNSRYRTTPAKDPLLRVARVDAAKDVVKLIRSAENAFADQIIQASSGDVRYVPNPTFAGSEDVGGADADLIIGDTLYDLKCTRHLDPRAIREALLQLVGYCLLDYRDTYKIRNVAVYFPRYEWVATWPLWMLVYPTRDVLKLADLPVDARSEPAEKEVKSRLKALRAGMRTVAKGKWLDYTAMPGYQVPAYARELVTRENWDRQRTEKRRADRELARQLGELYEWQLQFAPSQEERSERARERQRAVIRGWDAEDQPRDTGTDLPAITG